MSAVNETVSTRDNYPPLKEDMGRVHQQDAFIPASYFRWKGIVDWCLAAALLVPGLLLIAFLALLVRFTSWGPGIFKQPRVGKGGRIFMMYKIRTMRQDAEAVTGPVWTQARDPRVTPLGKVLRRLHLDELPQLFNVLKGEMSLVGPRPERPEFVRVLAAVIPGYRNRLAVRPGVTGLAQINLPPDSGITSVQRKLVLDCEYIECGGLLLDIRLMLCTFLRMFKVPEQRLHVALGLGRDVKIPALGTTDSGNAEQAEDSAEVTPARILLEIGDPPNADMTDAEAPGTPGHGTSNGNHGGEGNGQRNGHARGASPDNLRSQRHRLINGRKKPH